MATTDRPAGASDPAALESELAGLRAEVARLRAEKEASVSGARPDRSGWWRPVVVGVLVLVVALLAPLSVLATWADGQVQETDRYLDTVGPLAGEPAVQDAIAARIEEVVFTYVDVDAAVAEVVQAVSATGVPQAAAVTLQAVEQPLANGIRNFVSGRIEEFVRSDTFQEAWVTANRVAHEQIVGALLGEGEAVSIDRGEVTISLGPIIEQVKQRLVDGGFALASRVPEVDPTFTIVQSDDLGTVQQLLGVLDDLALWLPVIGLGLLGVAVAVARDRRRALIAGGAAVAVSMLLLGATLNAIRPFYLEALPASSSSDAAGAVYDQLVSFIRFALRGLLVVAVAVTVGAWLSASHGPGATTRAGLVRGIDAVRRGGGRAGLNTGRLGVALARYRVAVRAVILAGSALWYLSIDYPEGSTAVVFVVVTVVLLLLAELLAAGPTEQAEETEPAEPVDRVMQEDTT